jgi:hypothetical protein
MLNPDELSDDLIDIWLSRVESLPPKVLTRRLLGRR